MENKTSTKKIIAIVLITLQIIGIIGTLASGGLFLDSIGAFIGYFLIGIIGGCLLYSDYKDNNTAQKSNINQFNNLQKQQASSDDKIWEKAIELSETLRAQKEDEDLIQDILLHTSLYSGVPIEKMNPDIKRELHEFMINCMKQHLLPSQKEDEFNNIIWGHILKENQLKELDITQLPNDDKVIVFLYKTIKETSLNILKNTNLKASEEDYKLIKEKTSRYIHKFVNGMPNEFDYHVFSIIVFSILINNKSNHHQLLKHGNEFYDSILKTNKSFLDSLDICLYSNILTIEYMIKDINNLMELINKL